MARVLSTREKSARLAAAAVICGVSLSYIAGSILEEGVHSYFQASVRINFPVIEPVLALEDFSQRLRMDAAPPAAISTPAPLLALSGVGQSGSSLTLFRTKPKAGSDFAATATAGAPGPIASEQPVTGKVIQVNNHIAAQILAAEATQVVPKAVVVAQPTTVSTPRVEDKIISAAAAPATKNTSRNQSVREFIENDEPRDLSIPEEGLVHVVENSTPESQEELPELGNQDTKERIVTYLSTLPLNSLAEGGENKSGVLSEDRRPKQIIQDRTTQVAAAPNLHPGIKVRVAGERLVSGALSGGLPERGHFEVGIYERVDTSGRPVGYPILWQTLRPGERDFRIPHKTDIRNGYLFARHVGTTGAQETWYAYAQNPIQSTAYDNVVGAKIQITTTRAAVAAVAPEKTILRGTIRNVLAPEARIANATIRVRGTKWTGSADASGVFVLEIPLRQGGVLLEISAPGYMPAIEQVLIKNGQSQPVLVELASREAIERMAINMGSRQAADKAVMIGRVQSGVRGREGARVRLTLAATGPFYFRPTGFPASPQELSQTSEDGRFIYFNVAPGEGFLETTVAGETAAPFMISSVGGGQAISKRIELKEMRIGGRLYHAIPDSTGRMAPLGGARVRVEGGSTWATTDAFGAFELPDLHFVAGQEVSLEVTANGFYNHRYTYRIGDGALQRRDLFAFPTEYVNGLARMTETRLDEYAGVVIGSVGAGRKLRMDALADNASSNNAKDFYFDSSRAIQGSYSHTDESFGTFVIMNVPYGRGLLQGVSSAGVVEYSEVTHIAPSTVHVLTAD